MMTKSNHYGIMKWMEYPEYTCSLFQWADTVQYDLQLYIISNEKTLQKVYSNIDAFRQEYPDHACEIVGFALWRIEHELLKREWYELLSRYQKAVKHLHSKYPIIPFTDEDKGNRKLPLEPPNPWYEYL